MTSSENRINAIYHNAMAEHHLKCRRMQRKINEAFNQLLKERGVKVTRGRRSKVAS